MLVCIVTLGEIVLISQQIIFLSWVILLEQMVVIFVIAFGGTLQNTRHEQAGSENTSEKQGWLALRQVLNITQKCSRVASTQ
jgi:hypothetical protein